MWALLWIGLAAASGEPEDVREVLRQGVTLNWTTLTLEAEATDRGYGVGSSPAAVEQNVRRAMGPSLANAAMEIPLDNRNQLGDLELLDKSVYEQVRARLSQWEVNEARYYTSGRVDLRGEISVQQLLKPVALARARPAPEGKQPAFTGLVVDARGLDVRPVIFPRILDDAGAVLWTGVNWTRSALDALPAIYVTSPTSGATTRAGANPLILLAGGARSGEVALSPEDSVRFRAGLSEAAVLGEGRVVFVIDAP